MGHGFVEGMSGPPANAVIVCPNRLFLTCSTLPVPMDTLTLSPAITEIRQALDQRNKRGEPTPFFFIVGAGLSHPQVPLAGDIEAACKKEALLYNPLLAFDEQSASGAYSFWFEKAFPHAEDRQQHLRLLMSDVSISKANFRLAHILLSKRLANMVVTPNFDDFLSQALRLFGERPITCDHPLTMERINVESELTQIIHVHGTYWFYDCCNLKSEINERATTIAAITVKSTLDEILHRRSPLVVGYSGWEDDVIMRALHDRLRYKLGTNIYWFCFRRKELDLLPDWLKVPGVRFVVPAEATTKTDILSKDLADPENTQLDLIQVENKNSDPALTAVDVLDG